MKDYKGKLIYVICSLGMMLMSLFHLIFNDYTNMNYFGYIKIGSAIIVIIIVPISLLLLFIHIKKSLKVEK